MHSDELYRLQYRRQYLLVPEKIDCPFLHQAIRLDDTYTLYVHRDLVVTDSHAQGKRLIMLGDMFDFENPQKGNEEILMDLSTTNLDGLCEMIGKYTGRFVLILIDHEDIILLHDATAARKIYYGLRNNVPWFGSHTHLLARIMGFKMSANESKVEFYKSSDFISLNGSNLGDTTCYDEITQLMPNHYFDLTSNRIVRYWPNKELRRISFHDAVEQCSTMLKGFMEAIAARYKIMLPVTSGSDSRLLVSATKNFKEEVHYYVNQDSVISDRHKDIRIPKKLFDRLGIDFEIIHLPVKIDPEFRQIYFQNNPLASKIYLPHSYSYYLNHSDSVNCPGNIASAPWGVEHMNWKKVQIEDLIRFYGVIDHDHAKGYYRKWWDESHPLCQEVNLNVINLFYWEERIANWGGQVTLDKDIAQEEFNPFNSRLFNELFLSVPLRFNNEPDKKLHKHIILKLWPELMMIPFNPSFRKSLQMILVHAGLFTFTCRTNYWLRNLWRK